MATDLYLLVMLMGEQIQEATKLRITAFLLWVHDEAEICSGRCQLIFGSLESWLLNSNWRDVLESMVFQENIMQIVVDEVQLTYEQLSVGY